MSSSEAKFGRLPARSEAMLPVGFVKNHVIEASDDFVDLADMKIGGSAPHAFMLQTGDSSTATVLAGVNRTHRRLVNVEHTFVTDKTGLRWEDIHVKGAGYTPPQSREQLRAAHWYKKKKSYEGMYYGLLDEAEALRESNNAELFARLGIRSERVLCVTELDELMDDDGPKPVSYFRSDSTPTERRISDNFVPALLIRALRTNTRLSQMSGAGLPGERAPGEIRRAMELVSEEINEPGMRDDPRRFVRWFAGSLGHDLGVMHRNGYVHRWLHGQNVTLDARIIDLDSVRSRKDFEAGNAVPEGAPFQSYSFGQFVEKDWEDLRAAVVAGCERVLEHTLGVDDTSVRPDAGHDFDIAYDAAYLPKP